MTKATKPIYNVPVYWEDKQGISSVGNLFEESYFGKLGVKIKLIVSPAFYKNYPKLSEEKKKKWNSFKFREGEIEKILNCEKRHKNKNGDYICGPPTTEDEPDENSHNGYFGICCIQGYDTDERSFCPYNLIKENSDLTSFYSKYNNFIRESKTKIGIMESNYSSRIGDLEKREDSNLQEAKKLTIKNLEKILKKLQTFQKIINQQ